MARERRIFSIGVQSILKHLISRKLRLIIVIVLSILLGLITTLSIPAWSDNDTPFPHSASTIQSSSRKALELAREGQQRYNAGQFDQAAKLWQQATEAYEQAGERDGMTKSLINKSQALQALGLYPKACKTLLQVFAVDNPDCSSEQLDGLSKTLSQQSDSLFLTQAIALRSLGDVLRRQGLLEESQVFLQLSWSIAAGSPESSATLLSLGNTERALGKQRQNRWDYEEITEIIDGQFQQAVISLYQQAFNFYKEAAATDSAAPLTKIQAQLNHFSLLGEIDEWWTEQTNRRLASWSRLNQSQLTQRAKDFLLQLESELNQQALALPDQIESELASLIPSRAAVYARINLAQSLMRRQQLTHAQTLLSTAVQQARTLSDKRAETYALGYLGQIYDRQGQWSNATRLTRQALSLAQEQALNGDAREITYLWQSQLGRLLKEQGDTPGALASYTAAFNTLQSLRTDLKAHHQNVQFDFNQEVKPVYLDLADLLLQSGLSEEELNSLVMLNPSLTQKQYEAKNPPHLDLARRVIESLQLAELDNFFQDPCSEETDVAVQIDEIDPQAAVIYPLVFPERLEVILSQPGKPLQASVTQLGEREVNETLDELYDNLYNESVDNSALNIFRTIPLNPEELEENIQKLLPILTKTYNWLIRPFEPELDSNHIRTLVFVLNGRWQRVPMAALYNGQQYLIERYNIASVPSLQLIDSEQLQREQIRVLAAGVSQQVELRGEIFPALTNVPQELDQIQQAFPDSQKLLNEEFTAITVQNQLKSDFPFVHLATHGLFSSNPEKTFLLTGDRHALNIDQLRALLATGEARVPELLVLSACETATGDERAVLGLAGMAVRSGARSTLATLWPVGDASTAQLMGQFYQALKKPGVKKSEALRIAQLSMLESLKVNPPFEEFEKMTPHPYYWAPYVLVGNWQ